MLKKLKSALKSHKDQFLPLTLKAIIFSLLLLGASSSWLIATLFVLAAIFFYFKPFLNNRQFFSSFFILLAGSLFLTDEWSVLNGQWLLLISFGFGCLFFLLLGVKNLIFINRQGAYYFLNSLLLLTVFIFFFNLGGPRLFSFNYLIIFLAILFLLREILSFVMPSISRQKKNLISFGIAFLTLQFFWLISFLPINFFNAACLVLLITLIVEDFIFRHFFGAISREVILRNVTLMVILSIIIFGVSKYGF